MPPQPVFASFALKKTSRVLASNIKGLLVQINSKHQPKLIN